MKGILLAGGSGSRLFPLTKITSKQLLPVYDKPMIYYPLATLMQFGIREILIISTPEDIPNIKRLLGNGTQYGLNISYKIQEKPNGIAEAFIIAEDFIRGDSVSLILGDNIFYIEGQLGHFNDIVSNLSKDKALLFSYHVTDPERFGVVEFDDKYNVLSIEEKPKKAKSNYVSVGLYFFPSDVVDKAKVLRPSLRGELEITDILKMYLVEGKIQVVPMKRGNAWLDAGTPMSLLEASQFVAMIEKRQGLKIACLEEIAYRLGYITLNELNDTIKKMKDGIDYKNYLIKVSKEYHELY